MASINGRVQKLRSANRNVMTATPAKITVIVSVRSRGDR